MATINDARSQVAQELQPPQTAAELRTFGVLVRTHREKQGFTQSEFGELLGLGQARVSDLEHGELNVTLAMYGRLIDLLPEVFQQFSQKNGANATVAAVRHARAWSQKELKQLESLHVKEGLSFATIAERLGRTEVGARNTWYRSGLQKKHPNFAHSKKPGTSSDAAEVETLTEEPTEVEDIILPTVEATPPATQLTPVAGPDTMPEMLLQMLVYVQQNIALLGGGVELNAANMSCAMAVKWMEQYVARTRTGR